MTVYHCCAHCAEGPEDVNGNRSPCGVGHDEPCDLEDCAAGRAEWDAPA